MNLDALFRDYEARLAAQVQANLELDAREQQKAEFAKIQMGDRLAAQQGGEDCCLCGRGSKG